ncbi:phosphopantetheine-binding protein [Duganella violaceipulchra]|uniref:Acyl carrier protein n=1 Tax=Duganella violaceipulchra TaxID=2849652 RepID=A0AA41HEI0_9BURK|nr:phosphopantetheine-binding protein [Duganella violaceicalia]MBV6322686.1 acyl carrier protein [Duganella violaceicalia]MCP2010900.1 acyl carrier protein [Duganella violaceicalia]
MNSFPTVAKLLAKSLDVAEETIQPQTELEALGADSLTVIELIFDLEEAFGIEVGDERPKLVVVQDIADQIDTYLAGKAANA